MLPHLNGKLEHVTCKFSNINISSVMLVLHLITWWEVMEEVSMALQPDLQAKK